MPLVDEVQIRGCEAISKIELVPRILRVASLDRGLMACGV